MMDLNKPVATARQLYHLLSEVARSLQNCQPEGDSVVESSLKTRVVNEIILILEENGYRVSVTRMTPVKECHLGRYSMGYELNLRIMFNEGDYDSVITAIQSILTEDS